MPLKWTWTIEDSEGKAGDERLYTLRRGQVHCGIFTTDQILSYLQTHGRPEDMVQYKSTLWVCLQDYLNDDVTASPLYYDLGPVNVTKELNTSDSTSPPTLTEPDELTEEW